MSDQWLLTILIFAGAFFFLCAGVLLLALAKEMKADARRQELENQERENKLK